MGRISKRSAAMKRAWETRKENAATKKDPNLEYYNEETFENSMCVNMSVIVDNARKLGSNTLCDYVEFLEYQNKNFKNIIHSKSFIRGMQK